MYYAIYDNQNGELKSFALNLTNKNKVREKLIDYLTLGNFSEEGEISLKENTLDELCNFYEFTLIENQNHITDDLILGLR